MRGGGGLCDQTDFFFQSILVGTCLRDGAAPPRVVIIGPNCVVEKLTNVGSSFMGFRQRVRMFLVTF